MEISASTNLLAVIGDPIHHSMSPTMHNVAISDLKIDYAYVAFHVKASYLKKACEGFRALNIKGVNVTIPHKVEIMKYMDEISPLALGIGAVNTIKNVDGKLHAKNTDGIGALKSIQDAGFDPRNKKCVILGAGGAAKAIAFTLAQFTSEIILINRTYSTAMTLKDNLIDFFSSEDNRNKLNIDDAPIIKALDWNSNEVNEHIRESNLLINTTSVGMHPKIAQSPLDTLTVALHSDLFVFDCVYNPLNTRFLQAAKDNGCQILEGIDMLVNQGAEAFEWWTGKTPNTKLMKEAAIKKLGL